MPNGDEVSFLCYTCFSESDKNMNKRQSFLETTILIIELLKRIPKSWWITAQQMQLEESNPFFIDMNRNRKPYSYRWSQCMLGA